MRAKERDLFSKQMKFPGEDYCYPIPREVSDVYDAPSDGGSYWQYSGFEDCFFEETHRCSRWSWLIREEPPTREEAWKEWKKLIRK
jgi:hypothetical protein